MSADDENETALITCSTTKGVLEMEMYRKWAKYGYDRAVYLFEHGFYDHSHFYRVVPTFLVQFGISYSQDENLKALGRSTIPDDPKVVDPEPVKFEPGIISYAGSGPNSRNSQLFISYSSAESLGRELWETPIGKVINNGVENVASKFYSYGDMPPWGHGPEQGPIHNQGSKYIEDNFPLLDKFITCSVVRKSSTVKNKEDFDEKSSNKKKEQGAAKPPPNLVNSESRKSNVIMPKDTENVEELVADRRIEQLRKKYNRELQTLREKMPDDNSLNILVFVLVAFLLLCGIFLVKRANGKGKANGKEV